MKTRGGGASDTKGPGGTALARLLAGAIGAINGLAAEGWSSRWPWAATARRLDHGPATPTTHAQVGLLWRGGGGSVRMVRLMGETAPRSVRDRFAFSAAEEGAFSLGLVNTSSRLRGLLPKAEATSRARWLRGGRWPER